MPCWEMVQMISAKDIIALAEKQIGVKDDPIGSCNNKYNTAYYGGKVNNPALAWCVVFIWWLFRELKASDLFCDGEKMASVPALYAWYKRDGQIVTTPKAGDIVFYDFNKNGTPDHVGVVAEVKSNGGVVAIEGNTSAANQANGGTVQKKTRTKSQIYGFARPKYTTDGKSEFVAEIQKALGVKASGKYNAATLAATVTVSLYKNRTHAVVKVLQKRLKELGYSVGTIDGIAGPKFVAAVRAYQKANGCIADGIITAKAQTWKTLLK